MCLLVVAGQVQARPLGVCPRQPKDILVLAPRPQSPSQAGLVKDASAAYTADGLFKFFKAYQASGGFNPEVNHARVCALTKKYAGACRLRAAACWTGHAWRAVMLACTGCALGSAAGTHVLRLGRA